MTRNKLTHVFAFALLLAMSLPALAAAKNTKQINGSVLEKGNFTLYATRSLNGVTLKAGDYKVLATDSQISFVRDGKVVAQASIQWKDAQRADGNTLLADGGNIKEIQFKGKKRSAVVL